jgi:N4-gp56 family major capsid protein
MAVQTYGDISPRTAAYAAKKLLSRGQDMLVTERFGHFDPQGKKKSKVRKWRRYNSLSPATTALTEGVTPSGSAISFTDYTATLEQYGDWVQISDVIADTHEDPVLMEMMEVAGEQAAETIELLRIAVLQAGTNVFFAGTAADREAVNAAPSLGDFRRINRSFKRNKAKEIAKIIKAGPNIATEPVNKAYFAMGHTDLDPDIRSIAGFIPVEKYSQVQKALPGEVGKVENIRIILTNLFSPFEAAGTDTPGNTAFLTGGVAGTGAPDVYPIIVVARDAYGIVPLQGHNAVKPSVMNPGTVDKSDPLGQTGFVSWKTYQATVILNQSWIARLECCATANPS